MLERAAALLTRWCTRFVPDAFVIAGVLTVVVFAAALGLTPAGPLELVRHWGEGFWGFVPFTLQMAMVILTGYIVADAPPVRRALAGLAARPRSARGAIALVAVVSMGLAFLNWGLSIVASAVLARRLGQRRLGVDFRLLVATAYLGLGCMWHAGLSASAPLTSSDPTQGFVKSYLGAPVPVTETIFSPFNLLLAAVVLVVMTACAVLMQPRPARGAGAGPSPLAPLATDAAADAAADDRDEAGPGPATALAAGSPAEWLERTPWVNLIFAAAALSYLPLFLAGAGLGRLQIGHVNLLFFGLGALLHRTPASLLASAERGGRYVWGVLLQFGLYAGVAGMMDGSGLATRIADAFTHFASARTFPLVVVWYSGLLNYVVPSGGAKWFLEVQYLAEASRELGVPVSKTIVAYAWGDMFTDVIQPFWAIPLLGLAKLGFRDIMGYCLIFFLVFAALVSGGFLLYGW